MSEKSLRMMRKIYPINQSPLYALSGLGQLEQCLDIRLNKLDKLLKDGNYRTWFNSNNREIQHPLGWLSVVHSRLARYLSRIETPDYVYHKRTRSYVDNAAQHKGYHPVAKTDISRFYPSTTKLMVKEMFVKQFNCARDVAGILADICCYQSKHLPTGSAISSYIAFFASKTLFDRVYEHAKSHNCTFTLYVDDLTFSGDAASKALINTVRAIIKQEGHTSKTEKTHTFSSHAAKTITGVIIKGNKCLLPNIQHKAINEARKAIKFASTEDEKIRLKKSLKGRLLAAKQVRDVNDKLEQFPELIYS